MKMGAAPYRSTSRWEARKCFVARHSGLSRDQELFCSRGLQHVIMFSRSSLTTSLSQADILRRSGSLPEKLRSFCGRMGQAKEAVAAPHIYRSALLDTQRDR